MPAKKKGIIIIWYVVFYFITGLIIGISLYKTIAKITNDKEKLLGLICFAGAVVVWPAVLILIFGEEGEDQND